MFKHKYIKQSFKNSELRNITNSAKEIYLELDALENKSV